MRRKYGYRLLLALFGLIVFCLVTAGPHKLMNNLMFFGTVCCHNLQQYLPAVAVSLMVMATRSLVVATLLIGVSLFVRRIWQLYRFRTVLTTALGSVALPSRLASLCTQLGLVGDVCMFATTAPIAFCFGLLKPRIFLSTGLVDALTDKELKVVLVHEDHHRHHHDPLRALLADAVAQVFFFLPVAAEWRDRFYVESELAADRHAIHLAGRLSLATALHKLLTHPPVLPFPAGIGGVSGFSATNVRLTQLLDNITTPIPLSRRSLVHSSLILILACIVLQIALS